MKTFFRPIHWVSLLTIVLGTFISSPAFAEEFSVQETASRIFERVAGVPLALNDPRRAEVEAAVAAGDFVRAAAVATDDKNFINITVKQMITPTFNENHLVEEALNDGTATVLGIIRDDRDYREILYGNVTYVGSPNITNLPLISNASNEHYQFLDTNLIDLADPANLIPETQTTVSGIGASAGVLTTRAFGFAYIMAGTNRAGVEKTLQEFLCRPIETFKDTSIPNNFIRQDVSRAPGGDPSVFKNSCQGCHAGMDALGGAFAFLEFWPQSDTGRLRYGPSANLNDVCSGNNDCDNPTNPNELDSRGRAIPIFQNTRNLGVAYKMNRAPENPGRETPNDYWKNLWTADPSLGWRNSNRGLQSGLEGIGITEFGKMVANSRAFSVCQAKRVFKSLCYRPATISDDQEIQELAEKFEGENYSMKKLYQHAAASLNQCIRK